MYWIFCWKYVTPLVLSSLLIFELFNIGHFGFDQDYTYPWPIQLLGYAITASSIIWIPIFMFIERRKIASHSNSTSIRLLKPTAVRISVIYFDTFFSKFFLWLSGLGSTEKCLRYSYGKQSYYSIISCLLYVTTVPIICSQ